MNGKTQMIKFNFSPPKGGGEGGEGAKKDGWLIDFLNTCSENQGKNMEGGGSQVKEFPPQVKVRKSSGWEEGLVPVVL